MNPWFNEILQANLNDAYELTALTKLSKASWGYSEAQMELWTDQLTITPDYIQLNSLFKLMHQQSIIGYYSYLKKDQPIALLDMLFIHPEFQRRGLGKLLLQDAIQKIRESKFTTIRLESDPYAEPFYRSQGFQILSYRDTEISNRKLALMELKL